MTIIEQKSRPAANAPYMLLDNVNYNQLCYSISNVLTVVNVRTDLILIDFATPDTTKP